MATKPSAPKLNSRTDAEAALELLAQTTATRDRRLAELNTALANARAGFGDLETLEADVKRLEKDLEEWAITHPFEFPESKRSIECRHGTVGFRLGNPYVGTLKGWTWKKVLEAMQRARRTFGDYIRKKEEPDKEALLGAARPIEGKPKLEPEVLRRVGLTLAQDDNFYVELKQG